MSVSVYETSPSIPHHREGYSVPIKRETRVDVPVERIRSIITAATKRLGETHPSMTGDTGTRSVALALGDDVYLLRDGVFVYEQDDVKLERLGSDFEVLAVEKRKGVDCCMTEHVLADPNQAISLYTQGDDPVSLPLLFDTEPHQRHFLEALLQGSVIDQSRFFERYAPLEHTTEDTFMPTGVVYVLPRAA